MTAHKNIDQIARQLMTVMPQLNRIMVVELRQEVDESATMPQFRALAYLHQQPMTLTALAKLRRVSLQSAGELVQFLVERGWVTRTPDPADRRQYILQLTGEGHVKYERIQDRMMGQLVHYLELLTEEELSIVEQAFFALGRVIQPQEPVEVNDDNR